MATPVDVAPTRVLVRALLRAGVPRGELAARAGVSAATVGLIERGVTRRVYPDVRRGLLEAFESYVREGRWP